MQDWQPAGDEDEGELPPRLVVGGVQVNPLWAAIAGGAVAAGTATYLGARALARRNAGEGKVSSVMATAITACEVSHKH